jgi:hypothetical protein
MDEHFDQSLRAEKPQPAGTNKEVASDLQRGIDKAGGKRLPEGEEYVVDSSDRNGSIAERFRAKARASVPRLRELAKTTAAAEATADLQAAIDLHGAVAAGAQAALQALVNDGFAIRLAMESTIDLAIRNDPFPMQQPS